MGGTLTTSLGSLFRLRLVRNEPGFTPVSCPFHFLLGNRLFFVVVLRRPPKPEGTLTTSLGFLFRLRLVRNEPGFTSVSCPFHFLPGNRHTSQIPSRQPS